MPQADLRVGEQADRRVALIAVVAFALMTAALVGLLVRVAQLQLRPGPKLVEVIDPRTSARTDPAVRGDLLDRRGRLLASSRFGYRAFVDPTRIPEPPDTFIVAVAEAIGVPAEEVGGEILAVLEENKRRSATAAADLGQAAYTVQKTVEELAGGRVIEVPEDVSLDDDSPATGPKKVIRYRVISARVLSESQVNAVKALMSQRDAKTRKPIFPGLHLERRVVREYTAGEAAAIVGKVNMDGLGLIGAERLLNERLEGLAGKLQYVRDARGNPLWIEPGQVSPGTPGRDVLLSIDLEVQRIAHQELVRGVQDADSAGGRTVVMDPRTGEVLAMVDIVRDDLSLPEYPWEEAKSGRRVAGASAYDPDTRYRTIRVDDSRKVHPALARNRCVEDVYEPGSTFKPFVWSTITELRRATPDEVFDTEGGRWHTSYGRYIEDVTKAQTMTWREVLINSSNIGMIKGGERLSAKELRDAVVRFGFGRPTGLGLVGEASGIVTPLSRWSKFTQTSVSYGYEVAVTPLQMVHGFAAFCRTGTVAGTLTPIRITAVQPDDPDFNVVYRVLPPEVAVLTRETMSGVTMKMEERLAKISGEANWRYSIFGKSGTAKIPITEPPPGKRVPKGVSYFDRQYNSSFIAGGPTEEPRLVVVVVIDDPGPDAIRKRAHYGAAVAGPVVRRIMERTLTYMGVPPSLVPDGQPGPMQQKPGTDHTITPAPPLTRG